MSIYCISLRYGRSISNKTRERDDNDDSNLRINLKLAFRIWKPTSFLPCTTTQSTFMQNLKTIDIVDFELGLPLKEIISTDDRPMDEQTPRTSGTTTIGIVFEERKNN